MVCAAAQIQQGFLPPSSHSQGSAAGIAQVRGMELPLVFWNKFSGVIFPACPFSPLKRNQQTPCSRCSAVRSGFPAGLGMQAALSFGEKQRCLGGRKTLALAAQLVPLQGDDPALLGRKKSINSHHVGACYVYSSF